MEHADDIYAWRNDAETRIFSFNQNIIAKEQHLDWLEKTLLDSTRELYMVFDDELKVGYFRLDLNKDNTKTISIVVNPIYPHRGYGRAILKQIIKKRKVSILRAEILDTNMVSKKLFENAGFEKNEIKDGYSVYYYK